MKLLFITQKVDKDDDVLGIYHRWIEELAKKFDQINVICLYRGRVELPTNVTVYSLGKEKYAKHQSTNSAQMSRIKHLWHSHFIRRFVFLLRFYKYLWQLRGDYDRILVHMNPEYMILAGLLWKISGKKPILWYNHPMGGWKARVAIAIADRVLRTSPFAFSARYKKSMLMPVGIDTDVFRKIAAAPKKPRSILYLGRLSPIKYIEVLIDAVSILDAQGIDFTLTIAGEPSKESERAYAVSLKERAKELVKKGKVIFRSGVPNYQAPALYNAHFLSVNMTPTGSFDKTIIEAMACELPVIVSNHALREIFPSELAAKLMFEEKNSDDLAKKIAALLNLSDEEKNQIGKKMRQLIIEKHSLTSLVDKLTKIFHFDF